MLDMNTFIQAVHSRECVVGVVGMGYVGLPLALEFAEKGFSVIGFDIDEEKVQALNSGRSYIKHIPASRIKAAIEGATLQTTTDFHRIAEANAALIAVPTPLTVHHEPDMRFIVSTAEAIAPHLRPNQLIVLESTTYPGTTEGLLRDILEKGSGLKAGLDFFLAFSPEREDPNNKEYNTATIPKVVGGLDSDSLRAAMELYGEIIVRTIPVSSCAVAESTKLLENIFRAVNIALVNELKVIFHKMNIDVWEVINAAKSKPFGFMPFYPGPGLGGHCIPIDPFYLTWKALEFEVKTRFIELAGEINESMPAYVVHRTMEELNELGQCLQGRKLLLVGMSYKGDVDDIRESPTLKLFDLFTEKGAQVSYYDPYIPVIPKTREYRHLAGKESITLDEVDKFDVAVISTRHSKVDHYIFAEKCRLVIDTRHAIKEDRPNVRRA